MLINNPFWFGKATKPSLGTGQILIATASTAFYDMNNSTYSSNSSLTVPTGTSASQGTGVGNTVQGMFLGGLSGSSVYLKTTAKFTYLSSTWAQGTSLTSGAGCALGAGCGTSTVGMIFGGRTSLTNTSSVTNVYTYSGDTVATGGSLSAIYAQGYATGTPTLALMMQGVLNNLSNPTATTQKYTYSSNTASAGTSLLYSSFDPVAFGNHNIGIGAGGFYQTTFYSSTSVYTYSGDTTASGLTLAYGVGEAVGGGTSKGGVVIGGLTASSTNNRSSLVYVIGASSVVGGTNVLGNSCNNSTSVSSNPGYL